MIGEYRRISPEELQGLLESPDALQDLLYTDDGATDDSTQLNVDKAWHGIHFLLTGDAWSGDGPLGAAVLGGTEIGEDMGYGPARYLRPEEVRETAEALAQVGDDELRNRYDPAAFSAAQIYPDVWVEEGAEALEYVMNYLGDLRRFFAAAARSGDAMLLYIS